MRYSLKNFIFLAPLVLYSFIPALAAAQDPGSTGIPNSTAPINLIESGKPNSPSSEKRVWEVTLGGGVAVRPTYEGSDRYSVLPVPFVTATYDNWISLGANGLSAYWHRSGFRAGGGLSYGGGRKESKSSSIFNEGDDRLRGLGDISGALGLKAFVSYDLGGVDLRASVTKFTGADNEGVLVNVGASLRYSATDRFTLTPHAGATWGNGSYMQTFFGVTPVQAANSAFSQFSADSGVKDVGAGINANYRFDRHWFIGANADVKRLLGSAAKSPISFSNTEGVLFSTAGYRF